MLGFSHWNVSDSEPLKEEPKPRLLSEGCDLSPQWLHVHAWKGYRPIWWRLRANWTWCHVTFPLLKCWRNWKDRYRSPLCHADPDLRHFCHWGSLKHSRDCWNDLGVLGRRRTLECFKVIRRKKTPKTAVLSIELLSAGLWVPFECVRTFTRGAASLCSCAPVTS